MQFRRVADVHCDVTVQVHRSITSQHGMHFTINTDTSSYTHDFQLRYSEIPNWNSRLYLAMPLWNHNYANSTIYFSSVYELVGHITKNKHASRNRDVIHNVYGEAAISTGSCFSGNLSF